MLLSLRRSLLPGWVGCAPSGDSAAFAYVERRAGRAPAVRWIATAPWSDATVTLRALRRSRALHRHRCVAVLPRAHYQVLPLDAPDVPRDEWAQAIRWRLKDSVEFAVDDAAVQLLELPHDSSQRRRAQVLVVAAPRQPLSDLVRAAEDSGHAWTAIDIAETALRNICALVAEPGQVLALLHLGPTQGALVITVHDELLLSRPIALDLQQLQSADETLRLAAFDRAGLELQRTLDGFERQFSHLSLARLLVSPAGVTEPLCAHLRELLYVPVVALDLGAALDTSAVPELANPATLGAHLAAIGAALRED